MRSSGLQLQTRRLDGIFVIPESDLRNGTLDLAIGYFPDARFIAEHSGALVAANRDEGGARFSFSLPR